MCSGADETSVVWPVRFPRSSSDLASAVMASDSLVLAIERGDVELGRLLRFVRMRRACVDLEVGHQAALQGPAREHALHGFEDDALGEFALDDLAGRAGLEAAGIAGVPRSE